MINESRDVVGKISLTLSHKGYSENSRTQYALQIGASFGYKFGHLCFITN